MAISNSYVSLPEGILNHLLFQVGSFQRIGERNFGEFSYLRVRCEFGSNVQGCHGAEQEAQAEAKKGEKGGEQLHRKLVDTIPPTTLRLGAGKFVFARSGRQGLC